MSLRNKHETLFGPAPSLGRMITCALAVGWAWVGLGLNPVKAAAPLQQSCGRQCLERVRALTGAQERQGVGDRPLINMAQLSEAARESGTPALGVRSLDGGLASLPVPAIVHLRPNHFVLLLKVRAAEADIMDPALPEGGKYRTVDVRDLQRAWSGCALVFSASPFPGRFALLNGKEMETLEGACHFYHVPGKSPGGRRDPNPEDDPPNILVDMLTLNVRIPAVDAVWKGYGARWPLMRTYNSRMPQPGIFGNGWVFYFERYVKNAVVEWGPIYHYDASVYRGDGGYRLYAYQGDGRYYPEEGEYDRLFRPATNVFEVTFKGNKAVQRYEHTFSNRYGIRTLTDCNGRRLSFDWNLNRLTNITIHYSTGLNRNIRLAYNALGFCTNLLLPDGRAVAYDYQGSNLVKVVNSGGYTTRYEYGIADRLTNVITDSGAVGLTMKLDPAWTNWYPTCVRDAMGNPRYYETNMVTVPAYKVYVTVTDARGHRIKYGSDFVSGYCDEIIDAATQRVTMGWDYYGNRTSVCTTVGHRWGMTYDTSRATLTGFTEANGVKTRLTCDTNDNVTSISGPRNHVRAFAYDARQNALGVTNTAGDKAELIYDAAGFPIKLRRVDQSAESDELSYDGWGNLTQVVDRAGHKWIHTYDAAGRMLSFRDANTNLFAFQYDTLDRLTNMAFPSAEHVALAWDATSLRRAQGRDGRSLEMDWNPNGRLVRCRDAQGYELAYRYDGVGNLTNLVYPHGQMVRYEYDPLNRLERITDWRTNSLYFQYDILDGVTNILRSNGTRTRIARDLRGDPIGMNHQTTGGVALAGIACERDELGNILSETRSGGPWIGPPAASNHTVCDPADRLVSSGSDSFAHDGNGNLVRWSGPHGVRNYTYDERNMLTHASWPGHTNTYEYDALLNRISRREDGQITRYVNDVRGRLAQAVMEVTPAGKTNYYVYGMGLAWVLQGGTNAVFYHFDLEGNTVLLTDSAAAPVNRYLYEPFGERLAMTGSLANACCFNGLWGVMTERDGLVSMRARFYAPELGRFLSRDPLALASPANSYAFANHNPLRYCDPSGLLQEPVVDMGRRVFDWQIPIPPDPRDLPKDDLPEQLDGVGDYAEVGGHVIKALGNPVVGEALGTGGGLLGGIGFSSGILRDYGFGPIFNPATEAIKRATRGE